MAFWRNVTQRRGRQDARAARGSAQRAGLKPSRWLLLPALLLAGCAAHAGSEPTKTGDGERVAVRVGGTVLHVETALDDATRYRGLSHRESIPEDGGMLFVFPSPQQLSFVMRDCLTPIDIAFLDGAGRVLALHEMQLEPRREGESDADYNARLKRYPSRYRAQMALETGGGRLRALGLKVGDKIQLDFDVEALKARAR